MLRNELLLAGAAGEDAKEKRSSLSGIARRILDLEPNLTKEIYVFGSGPMMVSRMCSLFYDLYWSAAAFYRRNGDSIHNPVEPEDK